MFQKAEKAEWWISEKAKKAEKLKRGLKELKKLNILIAEQFL